MKTAAGITLVGVAVLFTCFSFAESPETKLTFHAEDLGRVHEETLAGTVAITNTGTEDIQVVSVKKSCSCNELKIPQIIPKGKSIDVPYSWDTRGMDGEAKRYS